MLERWAGARGVAIGLLTVGTIGVAAVLKSNGGGPVIQKPSGKDSSIWKAAFNHILRVEGGYVNNPSDRGGATNMGITQGTFNAYLKSHNLPQKSVKYITKAQVEDIYFNNYWRAAGCDKLPSALALAVFDVAVNSGVSTAKRLLAQSGKDLNKFFVLRQNQYLAYAKAPGQGQFLAGWLNRLKALKNLVTPYLVEAPGGNQDL